MACIKCSHVEDCGTIKRWLIDFNKSTLLKELNSEKENYPNFSFLTISGEVLKQKMFKLIEMSRLEKSKLKIANKASSKNRL